MTPPLAATALLASVLLASALLAPSGPATAQGSVSAGANVRPDARPEDRLDARYNAARDEYEIGHFQVAFAEFAALADGGHCEAARIALQMLRYGKSLYATEFHVALDRVQRWQHLPACEPALARR